MVSSDEQISSEGILYYINLYSSSKPRKAFYNSQHSRTESQIYLLKGNKIYQGIIPQNGENKRESRLHARVVKLQVPFIIMYTGKIKKNIEKDGKVEEFTFNILNNILPCNKSLTKWKLQNNDK